VRNDEERNRGIGAGRRQLQIEDLDDAARQLQSEVAGSQADAGALLDRVGDPG
jgi:hypothetical protein